MQSTWMNGTRLFRIMGITVFLHWSWVIVAAYEIFSGASRYSSRIWNAAEYLILFAIVLMHEFGHALACRSVGGTADQIMLWPLGGVAYVNPPPRPGALLWSIAAGPLVNVGLLFVTFPLYFAIHWGYLQAGADLGNLIFMVTLINASLLVFNLLPIYPLDGGQILQSLLWFVLGLARSMAVATVIGLIGSVLLAGLALYLHDYFLVAMAIFVASRAWIGWKQAAQVRAWETAPRRTDRACPACGTSPVVGNYWTCSNCKTKFDTFATNAICPGCSASYRVTMCNHCRTSSPIAAWQIGPVANRTVNGTPMVVSGTSA